MSYIAFLRGINVGGHHNVPMATLRQVFIDMGFGSVSTLLISGNVRFESADAIPSVVDLRDSRTVKTMEDLEKRLGKDITTRNWNTITKLNTTEE